MNKVTIADAPSCLSTHDKAMWVLGWNECAKAAQRTWVGLTDDEREELMDTYDVASTDYAKAIEAKLKEKNT